MTRKVKTDPGKILIWVAILLTITGVLYSLIVYLINYFSGEKFYEGITPGIIILLVGISLAILKNKIKFK